MAQENTLSHAIVGQDTLLKQAGLVLGGSLFIALASQISVPMIPVPMTLQTLAVLMVGLTLGSRLGAATLVTYLAQGAMGLPVFTFGMNGAAFFGPTAGFLIGFVAMAWLAGLVVEKGWAKGPITTVLAAVVISALLYIPGAIWPMFIAGAMGIEAGWVGLSASGIWAGFIAPFLIGDVVKSVIAAMIVTGGWAAIRSIKR
ncbi:biotin transporter BioY [Parasulfitobacter algicola]|uniref:Biotin transporter n=1 Tax=Parasulfitobacter algicola TaxID=2614809 RepID=A0ABX2ISG5_9RHOB|nr:biotin transporter BioY [Sulfitobacter algicola]NSX55849.1 biotin transporter BioY [Sulfitobacter algicola]